MIKADSIALSKTIPRGNGLCLDIGCGRSVHKKAIEEKGYRYIGLDHELGGNVIADACQLPFRDEVFPLVISIYSMEHFKEPRRVVSEVHRVLCREGCFIVIVPFLVAFHRTDYWRYTPLGIRELLSDFEVLDIRATCGLLTFACDLIVTPLSSMGLHILSNFIRDNVSLVDKILAGKMPAWAYAYLTIARKKHS